MNFTSTLQLGSPSSKSSMPPPTSSSSANERSTEDELLKRLADLPKARLEPLSRFLPLVLDKLFLLMVRPPCVAGHVLNVGQAAFNAIAAVVNRISSAVRTSLFVVKLCNLPSNDLNLFNIDRNNLFVSVYSPKSPI